jgi:MYXO-CTERM domain-containing protein
MRASSQARLARTLRIIIIAVVAFLSVATLVWVFIPGEIQPISSATHFAYRLIKVPEPPPWAMMALGVAVLVGVQQLRRRRKKA